MNESGSVSFSLPVGGAAFGGTVVESYDVYDQKDLGHPPDGVGNNLQNACPTYS